MLCRFSGELGFFLYLAQKGRSAVESPAARSTQVGDEDMPNDIRWIRSYVLGEESGAPGTVCIYQASSEEAIRKHAAAADLPISEIVPIADTVVVRPDPE